MSELAPPLRERLRGLRLLALDVDGVLTDGSLHYGEAGETIKSFNVRDGLGLQLLMRAGIEVALVSGRSSAALNRRVSDLGIRHFFAGREDKAAVVAALAHSLRIPLHAVAFVGDDVPDLEVFSRVGIGIAVADAHPAAKAAATWATRAGGGRGAVREIADAILHARDAVPGARREASLEPLAVDDSDFEVVIPARYASTRLPGKPLRTLGGEPLVAHVWRRGVESGARSVVIATDDERVRAAVESFGGVALMTSPAHPSGADRAAEVADRLDWPDDAVLVNLQGDEPFMAPDLVRRVASNLHRYPDVGIATLATPIRESGELLDPNVVKVVRDDRECALYFSRAPIPWVRGAFESGAGALRELPGGVPFLRHVGLYAYRVGILRRICGEKPRAEEAAESLEQLRALSLGVPIHVDVVPGAVARGVDTEEDLIRAERELRSRTA